MARLPHASLQYLSGLICLPVIICVLHCRQALSPVLLCSAAGTGDLEQLKNMVEAGSDVNAGDYDGRYGYPLHVTSLE